MSFERLAPERHDTLDDIPDPAENPLLIGHGEVALQVAEAYRAGRLHHAMLLAGPRGIGKATLAFHVARHLLAFPDPKTAPSEFRPAASDEQLFRQVAQGSHPALLHLTRPVNERSKGFKTVITVDEVRRIARFLSMTAHDGAYRVVIVDAADDMNINAANALLKNLEEPPQRTLFILISHSPGRLLPTIRSRCQLTRMRPLDQAELIETLDRLGAEPPARPELQARLASLARGSVREALILTRYGGLEVIDALARLTSAAKLDFTEATRVAEAVAARDGDRVFRIFNEAMLERAGDLARAAAGEGDIAVAERYSRTHADMAVTIAETETYNLDRRQHAMGLMRRLIEAHSG